MFKRSIVRLIRLILQRYPSLCNQGEYLLNLVRSIPEQFNNAIIRKHLINYVMFRSACVETYKYHTQMPIAFRPEMHFARRYVYRLRNVCVSVETGACCTPELAFQESFGSLRFWLFKLPVKYVASVKLKTNNSVVCLHSASYAHYLLEQIPRLLWAIKCYGDVDVLIPAETPAYITIILEELQRKNIFKGKILLSNKKTLFVKDFVFTQVEAYSGFWHSDDLFLLRSVFLLKEEHPEERNLQIYISRTLSKRSYINEVQIEEFMISRGIRVVYLEKLNFIDQIELLRKSRLVIAPHGAGLANLVWCSSGTTVVEIFIDEVFNDCFSRICTKLECRYYPLWASKAPNGYSIDDVVFENLIPDNTISLG